MPHEMRNICLGLLLAITVIVPGLARAADADSPTRLYPESQIVVRDRFSDEIVGNGPDLVFIPGLASSRATWKATADRLKDRYRLHLVQVAGFAGERARANATGPVLQPTADAIDAYLVEQHLTPATIIGHSLGGTIILYLAENHGADLKKAMVVDSFPFAGNLAGGPSATLASVQPMADKMRANPQPMPAAQEAAMMATMATAQPDRDTITAWTHASDTGVVANAFADDITLDLRPGLANIKTPITLLVPDYAALGRPPGVSAAIYQAMYAASPTVKIVPISNSLHFVMLDQPAQFSAALDAFLAQ